MKTTHTMAVAATLTLWLCVVHPVLANDRPQDVQRTAQPADHSQTPASQAPDPNHTPDSSHAPDTSQAADQSGAPDASSAGGQPAALPTPTPPNTGRLFGVLPNSSTIEAHTPFVDVTTRGTFGFAVEQSFDKMVYPFVGVVALLGVGQPDESYWLRYARALTDNAVSNFNTMAFLPLVFNQDPRYFQLGTGSVWYRAGYAASRILVTRSRTGAHRRFNVSEIGGTAIAGAFSNVYYPAAQSTASATLARIGSQVMWDTVAFEAKEFWPDIRRSLEKAFHRQRGAS